MEKAKEFYCDFLGFKADWEHTFEPGMPLYMQVSRGDLRLHLSEHHGDGSPGAHIHVEMTGLDDFHREVSGKGYKFLRPGVQDEFYGARAMHVIDPFGNASAATSSRTRTASESLQTTEDQLCRRMFTWVTFMENGVQIYECT